MRKSLEDALFATYPLIFRQKDLPLTQSGMGRGVECADGWYPILDGLCETLSEHARASGHPALEASQVKQKTGRLKFHTDGRCPWCEGAIDFASALSAHVCEETSRPGILMIKGRAMRTLAREVGEAMGYATAIVVDGDLGVEVTSEQTANLSPGWRMIAASLGSLGVAIAATDFSVSRAYGRPCLDTPLGKPRQAGAIICAQAQAIRTNPATGIMPISPDPDDPVV